MIDWTLHITDIFTVVGGAVFVSTVFIKLRDAIRDNTAAVGRISLILDKHEEKLSKHEEQINIWRGEKIGEASSSH